MSKKRRCFIKIGRKLSSVQCYKTRLIFFFFLTIMRRFVKNVKITGPKYF